MNREQASASRWDQQFLATTRGKIVVLLRRSSCTVKQLAEALDMTQNAVRAHLVVLQRDGLIDQQTVRVGVGKPAYVYSLTPQAERLYPRAHEEMLTNLLEVVRQQLGPERLEEILRTVGQHMAAQHPIPTDGDLRNRLSAVVATLNQLGGLMELEDGDDSFYICGYSCPLSSAVRNHTQMCKLMETMITELVGAPVQERCERSESLSCWFEVPTVAP